MIDVIVPVYNSEKTLLNLIDSLNNQTFQDFKVIFVDDGSTDNSRRILEQAIAKRHDWILLAHEKNYGLGQARNSALERVTSEYVFSVDSDDELDKYCLEKLYRVIEKSSADIVYSDYTMSKEQLGKYCKKENTLTQKKFLRLIYREEGACFFWGRIYRTSLLKNTRFGQAPITEDLLFLSDLVSKKKLNIIHLHYFGYYYRPNPSGLIRSYNPQKYYFGIKLLEERISRKGMIKKGWIVNRILSILRGLARNVKQKDEILQAIRYAKRYKSYIFFSPFVSVKNRVFFMLPSFFLKRKI